MPIAENKKNLVALPTVDDPDYNPKEAKKLEKQMEKQDEQKKTFRGAAKAVSLASKLSPKAQQKKSNAPTTAQLKVNRCENVAVEACYNHCTEARIIDFCCLFVHLLIEAF